MTQQELSKAKDPDLIASLSAMKRAADTARKIAMQTSTAIVIVKNQRVVRVTHDELRYQDTA
jgi:hypothetical protein